MSASLAALDSVLERGQKEEKLVVEVLDELLQIERSARFERRIQTNLRLAGLPARTSLDSFDFTAAPDVPRKTLEELMTLRFLHQGENILFLGPCGVGKTHLATALALQAIESGHRVYFLTCPGTPRFAQLGDTYFCAPPGSEFLDFSSSLGRGRSTR